MRDGKENFSSFLCFASIAAFFVIAGAISSRRERRQIQEWAWHNSLKVQQITRVAKMDRSDPSMFDIVVSTDGPDVKHGRVILVPRTFRLTPRIDVSWKD